MKYLVVIPARYESSRLPGKPLIELNGLPMVIRTYRQCLKVVSAELICVATDDDRIQQVCTAEGIRVVRTSNECLTGTDRIAEVARHEQADVFINIQGDEPVFNPGDLVALLRAGTVPSLFPINSIARASQRLFSDLTVVYSICLVRRFQVARIVA